MFLRTMQFQHRCFGFSFDEQMRNVVRFLHGLLDQLTFFTLRGTQYITHHIAAFTGMTYADAQAPEVACAQMRDDVLQAIMPAMSPTQLELGRAWG